MITRTQSSNWPQIAQLPEAEFEELLAEHRLRAEKVHKQMLGNAAKLRRGGQSQPAGDTEYCRVVVRIRERTHRGRNAFAIREPSR
jgi:hypothetical protein